MASFRRRWVRELTWPNIVRLIGAGAAIYGVSPLVGSADRATILGFAGSLILAPLVAGAQGKRNGD